VGILVGLGVGRLVGILVGLGVGIFVGILLGLGVGSFVGLLVGLGVGCLVGVFVGNLVGTGVIALPLATEISAYPAVASIEFTSTCAGIPLTSKV